MGCSPKLARLRLRRGSHWAVRAVLASGKRGAAMPAQLSRQLVGLQHKVAYPINMSGRKIKVGVAGFSYNDWAEIVYPASLKSVQRLAYLARYLDLVEINTSVLRSDQASRWARVVPRGGQHESCFRFYREALSRFHTFTYCSCGADVGEGHSLYRERCCGNKGWLRFTCGAGKTRGCPRPVPHLVQVDRRKSCTP